MGTDAASGFDRQLFAKAGVLAKEERPSAHDRPAQAPAELVAKEIEFLDREGRSRVERLVAVELVRAAVKVVTAALGDDVDDRAGRPAELGRRAAGHHTEFLDAVDGRKDRDTVDQRLVVVHPVEKKIIELLPYAVHRQGGASGVAVAKRFSIAAAAVGIAAGNAAMHPGSERRQLREVPPVEGQLLDLLFADDGADRRADPINDRDLGDNLHRFSQPARREVEIQLQYLVHREVDDRNFLRRETGERRPDRITARAQRRHGVPPGAISHPRRRHLCRAIGRGHGHSRQCSAGGVGDHALDAAGVALREPWCGQHQHEDRRQPQPAGQARQSVHDQPPPGHEKRR